MERALRRIARPGTARCVSRALPAASALALLAALVLSIGSSLAGGLLWIAGLPLTLAAFALMCRAMWRVDTGAWAYDWKRTAVLWLSAMAALGIVAPPSHGTVWFEVVRRGFALGGLVCVAFFGADRPEWRRRSVMAAVVGATLLHLVTPLGTPQPVIDVFAWTETATRALLHYVHPYTVQAPDVYGGTRNAGFTVVVYPYMPATLLMFAPWVALFGDFRFGLAVCLPVTVWFLRATGRRLGVQQDLIDVATLALVLHPNGPTFVRSGWTESLLIVVVSAFVYLQVRWPGGNLQAVAFCLIPALKQYFLAPIALYSLMLPRLRWRAVLAGIGVAALTVAPFLVWNWHATLDGMVFQMRAPVAPRVASTSLVSFMAFSWGHYPSVWTSVVVQALVGVIAGARLRRAGLGGLLLASAVALCATFLAGWQAFVNYYYFIGVVLLLASLTLAVEEEAACEKAS